MQTKLKRDGNATCLISQDQKSHQSTYPYPLSLMSNSTKAGEEETLCGLNVRGAVMDTRLMIWWTGTAEPKEVVGCKKLKVRFSFFTEDSASASVL